MGPSRHGMVPPKLANGEGSLHICKAEMTILKRQSDSRQGWAPTLGVGQWTKNFNTVTIRSVHYQKVKLCETSNTDFNLGTQILHKML